MEAADRILGAHQVVGAYGFWPTFHDAEVLWLQLSRRSQGDGRYGPILETLIHVVERRHALIQLRFRGVIELDLKGFNFQNLLHGLTLKDARDWQLERVRWDVRFESAFGVNASFQCYEIEVVRVVACDEAGEPI
jgi:hypothetical protein